MNHTYDVFGIGNPLMDIVVSVNDDFLKNLGLTKGMFNLVDLDGSKKVYKAISHLKMEVEAGDSTANTMAGIANLGGKPIYQGCVGIDDYGKLYEEKTKSQGIESRIVRIENGNTGIAIALITPDSERSFATYLGVVSKLNKDHICYDDITRSKFLHLTGYQLEEPSLKEAAISAMRHAKKHGIKISVDLADKGVIARNRDFLLEMIKEYVHIFFVNEDESFALIGEAPEKAIEKMAKMAPIACLKIGKDGSYIAENGKIHKIQGYSAKPVDTTGAGDIYAAGVLFGLTNGHDIVASGKIGSFSAARIVEVFGARPKFSLKKLIAEQNII
ncbi:MAG: adenosine kinase [Candidatus Wallbacteria bacterium]